MKTKFSVLFLLILTCSPFAESASVKEIIEVGKQIVEAFNALLGLAINVNEFTDLIQFKKNEKLLFSQLDAINVQLREVSELNKNIHVIDGKLNMIVRMLQNIPDTTRLELHLHDIREKQIYLDKYYNDLVKYCTDFNEYENSTLRNFANRVLSHLSNSVPDMIHTVYTRVTARDFLSLFYRQFKPASDGYFCKEKQSLSQVLYNFLNEILIMNTKSYVLTKSAYVMKKLYEKGNFTKEIHDTDKEFETRNKHLITTVRRYMAKASTELWRCDPDNHVEDETYIELVNFLHGCIINKANINKGRKCRDECDVFTYETPKEKCYHANKWCRDQPPCRKIVNCQYIDSSMNVCSKNMAKDKRRYEYVEFSRGKIFGKKDSCSTEVSRLETYIYWIIFRCSYCFCLCDEYDKPSTERFINLHLVKTNTRNNRVVTGLRFVKRHKIIHLQIQEGKLLPYGQIDINSVGWVQPEYYTIQNRNMRRNYDYHIFTWEERGFDLDDVIAPEGSVVTGVRFSKVGHRIQLEVRFTPFNFTTGRLMDSFSFTKRNSDYKGELQLTATDVSTRAPKSFIFNSKKYVKFTNTGYQKDAGQTTVPFFDAQPVASTVPAPLAGIGIFHKGAMGFGGFIAPRIFTYNFTKHLEL